MNAINQITSILSAMGAQPETITRPNGETVIKVNAPPEALRGRLEEVQRRNGYGRIRKR